MHAFLLSIEKLVNIMQWCEVVIHTTTIGSELVSELLMEKGATGTEIVDRADLPDLTQPGVYWELYDVKMMDAMPEDVLVKAWFALDASTHDVLMQVQTALDSLREMTQDNLYGTLQLEKQTVADEDWSEVWKQFYKPFRIGERLVIKPSWETVQTKEDDVVVALDPGMAFGTGTHETTYMCMELLCKYLKQDMTIMDVGTGSGILAIVAAKLGASNVLAIDIDPDAVIVATDNVALNQAEGVRVIQGDLVKSEAIACELAVANIVADAICMLSEPLRHHLCDEGLLLCSGIIREREEDVLQALHEAGYRIVERMEKGEWVALCAQKETR